MEGVNAPTARLKGKGRKSLGKSSRYNLRESHTNHSSTQPGEASPPEEEVPTEGEAALANEPISQPEGAKPPPTKLSHSSILAHFLLLVTLFATFAFPFVIKSMIDWSLRYVASLVLAGLIVCLESPGIAGFAWKRYPIKRWKYFSILCLALSRAYAHPSGVLEISSMFTIRRFIDRHRAKGDTPNPADSRLSSSDPTLATSYEASPVLGTGLSRITHQVEELYRDLVSEAGKHDECVSKLRQELMHRETEVLARVLPILRVIEQRSLLEKTCVLNDKDFDAQEYVVSLLSPSLEPNERSRERTQSRLS